MPGGVFKNRKPKKRRDERHGGKGWLRMAKRINDEFYGLVTAQARYCARQIKRGLCSRCAQPLVSKWCCERHTREGRERARIYYLEKQKVRELKRLVTERLADK